jgi:carbon-monoxide dehydrogenase medium subunit
LRNGFLDVQRLVSLRHIDDLTGIGELPSGDLRLGSMATLREVAAAELVRRSHPALAQASATVGNPRVRAMATVGGAVVHGDPRQDVPPVLIALGARARLAGPRGEREVSMSEFFDGFMTTEVAEDELVLDVVVPAAPDAREVYLRFAPTSAEDFPLVAVSCSATVAADGVIAAVRVGVGGATSKPFLADATALIGTTGDADTIATVAAEAADAADPITDSRGSAAYKHAMFAEWVRRGLTAVLAR